MDRLDLAAELNDYYVRMAATKQIEVLLELSRAQREQKDMAGIKHADEAYGMAWQMRDLALTVKALKEKIAFNINVKPNYAEVEKLVTEMLGLVNVEEDIESAAYGYNLMGVCNDVKGNYLQSRDYYLQTIALLENVPDLNRACKVALGNAYHNIVKLFQQIEFQEDRFDYLEKALEVHASVDDMEGLARIWNLKASLLPADAPITERLSLFEKAYGFYEKGNDTTGAAVCLSNIGLCYCHLKDFDKGIAVMLQALEELKRAGHAPMTAWTLFQLGEGLRLQQKYEQAVDYLLQAEQTLLQANAMGYLNVVYQEMAFNLAALGRYKEAYDVQCKFIQHVSDRLDFDRQSTIEESRLKFELEKKERESEVLRRKNEEIELYNAKLQHSNAELNQFAYVASHDLKEPLRMVTNYMQLLEKSLDGKLTGDQLAYIRYANEGGKRMYTLIDSLLTYSRSTIDTQLRLVDLNEVLDEVKHIVITGSGRDVYIECDELPTILGDHTQMVQLFQNLLSNAIKYNRSDTAEIHIGYTANEDTHRIVVEDNGLGIAPQYREQVFEIFKRLHHRESYTGTGIGLSICKKIIHRVNGKIWIEDSKLGGAAFVFTIPKKSAGK